MPKKKAAQQRKRRQSPPWGKLLGGKPIERHAFIRDEKVDLGDDLAQQTRYFRMIRLLHHYGIVAPIPIHPVPGLVDISWSCWYQLALALASEQDESLKIIDGLPRGKTTARWRGLEGAELVSSVDLIRKTRPKRSIRWCLRIVQEKLYPDSYGRMPFDQLEVRYHEARKHHRTTKRAPNSKGAS